MAHRHRAIKGRETDGGWTVCVTPDACAHNPMRGKAHGGIERTDYCSCGATRTSERNYGSVNYGPWIEANGTNEWGYRDDE